MNPITLKRFVRRLRNFIRRSYLRFRDIFLTTYSYPIAVEGELTHLIPGKIEFLLNPIDIEINSNHLNHTFNLLGSGWVNIKYGMKCNGFETIKFKTKLFFAKKDLKSLPIKLINKANTTKSDKIWNMLSADYSPIDWQIDFKSGFRWSNKTWYRKIRYGNIEGIDIKVPWELSRMQHLPDLAIEYYYNKNPKVPIEFKNQILDWGSMNPPRFGVGWACAMDVGIRIANWVVAYDIFLASGVTFENSFNEIFKSFIFDHACHIVKNLEWSEFSRANHYLANIAGLIMATVYLPANKQTDAWLAFAIQELMVETDRQFLPDGGHFEGSTSYHRLCGEMIAISAIFVESLPEVRIVRLFNALPGLMTEGPGLDSRTPEGIRSTYNQTGRVFNDRFYSKLLLAAKFTDDLSKKDGSVTQIGDNDSGRFLRLGGWVKGQSNIDQCHLNHQQWLVWVYYLLGKPELLDSRFSETQGIPKSLASALCANKTPNVQFIFLSSTVTNFSKDNHQPFFHYSLAKVTHRLSSIYQAEKPNLFKNTYYLSYPNFGVFIVKSQLLHLIIRCGPEKKEGPTVHAHNDQLSFELIIDEKPITLDPGTFIYTPSKSWRNRYRSCNAHTGPSVSDQNIDSDMDIFSSLAYSTGECIYFGPEGFIGKSTIKGGEVLRKFFFKTKSIEIIDEYNLENDYVPASSDLFRPIKPLSFSFGYGLQ